MTQLKKGDTFKSKSGKKWVLAEDPKKAKNGAMYAKMEGGKSIFIRGCDKDYLEKIRKKHQASKSGSSS